jgi:hypothetical protein
MKEIRISTHALERMRLRGATEEEIYAAIETGDPEPARKGRTMYRKNFRKVWKGTRYNVKQVAPVIVEEADTLVVVTV